MPADQYDRLPLTTFRLSPATLAEMDEVAAHLTTDLRRANRADALRYAVRETLKKIRKNNPKKA